MHTNHQENGAVILYPSEAARRMENTWDNRRHYAWESEPSVVDEVKRESRLFFTGWLLTID